SPLSSPASKCRWRSYSRPPTAWPKPNENNDPFESSRPPYGHPPSGTSLISRDRPSERPWAKGRFEGGKGIHVADRPCGGRGGGRGDEFIGADIDQAIDRTDLGTGLIDVLELRGQVRPVVGETGVGSRVDGGRTGRQVVIEVGGVRETGVDRHQVGRQFPGVAAQDGARQGILAGENI